MNGLKLQQKAIASACALAMIFSVGVRSASAQTNNYAERADVQDFIAEIAARNSLDAAQIRDEISRAGVAVWLRADLDLLWARVRRKTTRPLLQTPDPFGTLRALHEARSPLYAQAEIAVDCAADLTIEAMTERVVDALLTRPDVLQRK